MISRISYQILLAVLLQAFCFTFVNAQSNPAPADRVACEELAILRVKDHAWSFTSGPAPTTLADTAKVELEWRSDRLWLQSYEDVVAVWLRIPIDHVLGCAEARMITSPLIGELRFMLPDDYIGLRGLNALDPRAYDRSSLRVDRSFAVGGSLYVYAEMYRPYAFGANLPSRSVPLTSSPVRGYSTFASTLAVRPSSVPTFNVYSLLTVGGSFTLMLYFLVLGWRAGQRRLYFSYSAFLLFTGIYWLDRAFVDTGLWLSFRDQTLVNIVSQLLFHLSYIAFIIRIIDADRLVPVLAKAWRVFAVGVGCYLLWVVYATCALQLYVPVRDSFVIERLVLLALSAVTFPVVLAKATNSTQRYIAIGSLAYCGLGLVAMVEGATYFALGTIVQILLFAYALGLRAEEERQQQILAEERAFTLEREVTRTRDAALRAQMKPHFVSNVINALRSLIIDGETDKAYNYLSRFAHVVRTMLGDTEYSLTTLQSEITSLQHYVALEALRFDREIVFDVEIEAGLDASRLIVPPLLLQPLVENSIHHGLQTLTDRQPKISLSVNRRRETVLELTVSDNGIGRDAAAKRRKVRSRESMATKIIAERLQLLDQQSAQQAADTDQAERIAISDLRDAEGLAVGTAVTLLMPLTLKTAPSPEAETTSSTGRAH